ncbi:MAG: beta-N-acetylhexosaminidase [Rikenellaceae bacterium]
MKKLLFVISALAFIVGCTPKIGNNAMNVVIPAPNTVIATDGVVTFKGGVEITHKGYDKKIALLENSLKEKFNIENNGKGVNITIIVDESSAIAEEGYLLNISKKGINITASTDAGAFYATQTLIQLMEDGKTENGIEIGYQTIDDAPRFAFRSLMLDESRHFFGEEEVLRILDAMAGIKMNVLHWHLTDDAGWRIEIKQYPLLTEVGSKRSDTEAGTWKSGKTQGKPHEGFYTQEQIKRIVKYAKERNIKVIPEIEMPGHASAAIAAYPWLSTKNETIEVPVTFGVHYNIYNVIDPKVEEFLQNVVTEVIELFDADIIHIGGDEVRFNHWEEDRKMAAYKKQKGFSSFMDIQIEFTNKMSNFIETKGASMMGWNEILGKNLHEGIISFEETSNKVASNVVVQFWKGDIAQLTEAAQGGYKLVNSYHVQTYLDYTYRSIPLKKAYSFNPIPDGLAEEYHKNIYGLGCQMWTEWCPEISDVHRQVFPRLAAYAEVGWSSLDVKDYDSFMSRLEPLTKVWEKDGIVGYSLETIIAEEKEAAEKEAAKKKAAEEKAAAEKAAAEKDTTEVVAE